MCLPATRPNLRANDPRRAALPLLGRRASHRGVPQSLLNVDRSDPRGCSRFDQLSCTPNRLTYGESSRHPKSD